MRTQELVGKALSRRSEENPQPTGPGYAGPESPTMASRLTWLQGHLGKTLQRLAGLSETVVCPEPEVPSTAQSEKGPIDLIGIVGALEHQAEKLAAITGTLEQNIGTIK